MKTVGIIAGAGQVPVAGVRAARARGWRVLAVPVAGEATPMAVDVAPAPDDPQCRALAAAGAECRPMAVSQYADIVATMVKEGVKDLYVMGKLPKTLVYSDDLDEAAREVVASRTGQGDHALIGAFVADLDRRGLTVRPQWELLSDHMVPRGFAAGRPLTAQEKADVRYGYRVARLLADEVDAGQTVVVKDGIVLAIEAAEGTDATIRRGGRLGGPGAVVVKVKGRHGLAYEVPAVGEDTLAAVRDAQAAVLAMEAGRTLLLEPGALHEQARKLGVAVVAVTEDEVA